MNTRHPFERIYSGWKDKFSIFSLNYSTERYYWRSQFKTVQLYETKNPHFDKDLDKLAASFLTFIKYAVGEDFSNIDYHFKPMAYNCAPCEIGFDYISRMDDMPGDMLQAFNETVSRPEDREVLDNICANRDSLPILKSYESQYQNQNQDSGKNLYVKSTSSAQKYFKRLAKYDLSLLIKIYYKYQWDFILFGFTLDGYF